MSAQTASASGGTPYVVNLKSSGQFRVSSGAPYAAGDRDEPPPFAQAAAGGLPFAQGTSSAAQHGERPPAFVADGPGASGGGLPAFVVAEASGGPERQAGSNSALPPFMQGERGACSAYAGGCRSDEAPYASSR
eukprot:m51a1_g8641 hypothetical protein (134) ;mRNA; f:3996-4788